MVGGDYNGHMGGVDKTDQLRGYQTTQRKSAKWWHTLFYWCLDITLVNAYVCYKSDFGRALAEGLVEKKDMLRGTHTVTWRCSSWTKLESTSMHPVGTRVVARWPLHETAQNSACRRVLSLQGHTMRLLGRARHAGR